MNRYFIPFCILLVCLLSPLYSTASTEYTSAVYSNPPKKKRSKVPQYPKKIIEQLLQEMPVCIDYKLDKWVLKYIRDYTLLARSKTEGTLGRTLLYFPIYERMLDKYNLPKDLKALSIIESALRPEALSYRGASGLWQFMPRTAEQYGIQINDYVDERNNPYKATEAAMKHLAKQHNRFEDWTLAIAAYNCGSGRMFSSIKKAKSKKYDKVKKYLPQETQKYVAKFVAAHYVMNYYLLYDLRPKYPDYNYMVTKVINISSYKTFKDLQDETGIALGVLKDLNPGYKNGIVPPNKDGNFIIVPMIGNKEENTKILTSYKEEEE